ncbi:BamA/TamA family outer membrane protein [Sphingobium sp. AN641]|uniref:autotransporter assembly complex protein TamA n=1 Tax=Sphingobium sp. AN641 TaxID=3133443 RepID=UPI0030BD5704
MYHVMRTCRRLVGRPLAPWLCAAPLAMMPALALAQQSPVDPAPFDPMPDIGLDWPEMDAPIAPRPIAPDPVDQPADMAEIETPPPTTDDTDVIVADTGEERRYTVAITGLDTIADAAFNARFDQASVLREGEGKLANLAQVNRRIKQDSDLLDRLLRAKGYYAARVRGSVAAPPAGSDRLAVTFDIAPGTQYLLSSVDIDGLEAAGERQPTLRDVFPVAPGDPVDADRILAARGSLALALGENGFPFARVDEPQVRIDHEERKGDLDIVVAPGGYRRFGRIVMANDRLFTARHVQRIARFDAEDVYKASDVEDLRRALVQTGLISSLRLEPRDAGDGAHVDIAVDARPAPLRTIAGELGYGTGEGYRAEVSWQHRNFFPPEGAVTLRGVVGTQEQTASVGYRRNNFLRRDNILTGLLSYSDVQRDAYDARTVTLAGGLERQTNIIFQKKWVWRIGAELIASDEADFFSAIAGGRRTFLIGALPLSLSYDGSDDLLNPTTGFRLGGRISPELSFQGSSFGYAKVQLDGSFYQPTGDRIVLAARARLGSILGSQVSRIAPSRRFYAGGGGSVRGYGYQAIGPRDADNDPIGGKSLAEFSLEARVRFGNFGVVPFVDAGNISTSFVPRFRDLRVGAGMGLRYYSSFGPIRVDVGTPINPQRGDPRVAVYVSLGQAF